MCNAPHESVGSGVVVESVERAGRRRSAYRPDLRRAARRHWAAVGVLVTLALAVLSPRLGAPGGALHTEFSACVPLCYVYYRAGRRSSAGALVGAARAHARLLAASVAHAHLVAPALCAALAYALRDALDPGAVRGVLLWSRGGGCAWLSLALCEHAAAPGAAALVWLAALPAAPLAAALLCDRAAFPSPGSVLLALGTVVAPFAAGLWRGAAPARGGVRVRLCALALLYAELCAGLQAAAGVLGAADVLAPLVLALLVLGALAAAAALWERSGLLAPGAARVLALCALPRAPDPRGWEAAGCAAGMARLPGVFLAPAQALLLAALAPDDAPPDLPLVAG